MGQEEPRQVAALGALISRHNGVLLEGNWLNRFTASNAPWLVFEVREKGVVIQRDPRKAARLRRGANAAATTMRWGTPGQIGSLLELANSDPLTWGWSQIRSITSTSRKVAVLESASGQSAEFRFGSLGGHQDTFTQLKRTAPAPPVEIGGLFI
jgi:hypothetical protein